MLSRPGDAAQGLGTKRFEICFIESLCVMQRVHLQPHYHPMYPQYRYVADTKITSHLRRRQNTSQQRTSSISNTIRSTTRKQFNKLLN
jgi:hypothetical protein